MSVTGDARGAPVTTLAPLPAAAMEHWCRYNGSDGALVSLAGPGGGQSYGGVRARVLTARDAGRTAITGEVAGEPPQVKRVSGDLSDSGLRRQLRAIRRELERAVPPLAAELRRISPVGDAAPGTGALRIECAVLLSWSGSLVAEMLRALGAMQKRLSRPSAAA